MLVCTVCKFINGWTPNFSLLIRMFAVAIVDLIFELFFKLLSCNFFGFIKYIKWLARYTQIRSKWMGGGVSRGGICLPLHYFPKMIYFNSNFSFFTEYRVYTFFHILESWKVIFALVETLFLATAQYFHFVLSSVYCNI